MLGGGIMAQEEFLYPRIRDSLDRHLKPVLAEHTRIAFAKHRNDAGMLGLFTISGRGGIPCKIKDRIWAISRICDMRPSYRTMKFKGPMWGFSTF